MSLFFESEVSVKAAKAAFTFKTGPDHAGLDTVLLGKTLWDSFVPTSKPHALCLSIRPLQNSIPSQHSRLHAIICWAVFDKEIDGLAIPPDWSKTYGHIFSRALAANTAKVPSLLVMPVEPVPLVEVVVTALSTRAYQAAQVHSAVETWFSSEYLILRHGAIYNFTFEQPAMNGDTSVHPSEYFQYRLDMLEPVLQGFAQKGTTKFIVVLSEENTDVMNSPDQTRQDEEDNDNEVIEIGEGFLANSALPPTFGSTETLYHSINGKHYGTGNLPEECVLETSFHAKALPQPVSTLEDQYTLFVRTTDLNRVGMLNGDWGMARLIDTTKYRLVRIVANDDLVDVSGTVIGSSILLHNICSLSPSEPPFRAPMNISLHSGPFGSSQPPIPIARTVTVARVASPVSLNRAYQPLFLKSLKEYFTSSRCLVKQGDIIAIPIDTDELSYLREAVDEDGPGFSDNRESRTRLPGFPFCANEIVFFCITNIEHDIMKIDSTPDVYVSSTIGELGCWVDPAITRMIQAGVEHCWMPDIGTYVEPASPKGLYLTLANLPFSHLLGPGSSYDKLLQLTSASLAQRAIDYDLNISILLKGARGIGKITTASWVAQRLGMHLLEINCYDLVGQSDVTTEGTLRARCDKARNCSPCICILRHLEAFAQTTQALESGKEPAIVKPLQDCMNDMRKSWKITGYPVVVLGTTSQPDRVPSSILSSFKHEITLEAPGEVERREILRCSLVDATLAPDVSLSDLATNTAALVASDLIDLVSRAKYASIERTIRVGGGYTPYLVQAGIALTAADFEVALGKARSLYSESIGAPKIPNVSWDDIGGVASVKSEILDTVQLPLEHPELFTDGLKKRSGILLYGPPGTGKTLLAKAVATSCSLNFFSIKGPELLNMYIGESEANVRRVFQRARDAKPCVIFFDELDSIAPKRGKQGDSGGVMDRIVSQLLAELDGMSSSVGGAGVFVIGATNRPDLLDPALLRPGRFDRMLYLGVSETHQAQTHILEALTRKFRLHPNLDLREVARKCPFNYTGADFYALCSDAMLIAMSRKAEAVEEKIAHLNKVRQHRPHPLTPQYFLAEMASPEDVEVLVSREDFDVALKALVPSVSQSELHHYASIQRQFSQRGTES